MTNRKYSLATQLSTAISILVVLLTIALSITLFTVGQSTLSNNVEDEFETIAEEEADKVSALISEETKILTVGIVVVDEMVDGVNEVNGQYANLSEDEIVADLLAKDEAWQASPDLANPLVSDILESRLSEVLGRFTQNAVGHTDVLVTDRYGGLVASSQISSDYYQADEDWWQSAWNGGAGATFISNPEFDERTGLVGIDIAIPMRAEDTGQIVGIVKSTYDITALASINIRLGETAKAHVIDTAGNLIQTSTTKQAAPPSFLLNGTIYEDIGSELNAVNQDDVDVVIGYAPIEAFNQTWGVVVEQERSEAFATITVLRNVVIGFSVVAVLLAVIVSIFLGRQLTGGLQILADVALQLGQGNLGVRAPTHSSTQEISQLATTFNTMTESLQARTAELNALNETLDLQVQERTAELDARAGQLQTVAEVSTVASTVLKLDELLPQVCRMTKADFNLYHAHIYLLDDQGETLILTAGAGRIGRQMVAEKRTIAYAAEQSLVATAARFREPVLSNDVTSDPEFLAHPLLPDTKAELAVPMIVGTEVIGVLDVQADQMNYFQDMDVQVMATLARQIAVAIRNARLYEERTVAEQQVSVRAGQLATVAEVSAAASTQLNLEELLPRVCNLTKNNFGLYHAHVYLLNPDGNTLILRAGAGEIGEQMVAEHRTIAFNAEHSLVAQAGRSQAVVISNDVRVDPHFLSHPLLPDTRAEMAIPLVVGDEVLGVLDVQASEVHYFQQEDANVLETLARQVAVAVRNAQAYEQQQQATAQLATVAEVSAVASTQLNLEDLLPLVCDLTNINFSLYHTHIYLLNEQRDTLVLTAGAGEIGEQMVAEVRTIPLNREDSLVAQAARAEDVVILNDVTVDPHFLPHPLLPGTRAEMAVPLILSDEVLDVQADKIDRFTETDVQVLSTLARQIAIAVRNASLYEERLEAETQIFERASQLATVAEVSAAASTELNLDKLLPQVCNLAKANFDLYHAHIYLLNPDGNTLILRAGAGEIGEQMVREVRTIAFNAEHSLVAQAARNHRVVVSNDVTVDPYFLSHPLLPDTRAEMAIPLVVGDKVLGVLDVQASEINYFSTDDGNVLSTLARQVAVAVQNAQAYQYQLELTEELRELDRLKSEFLANMSHELRTPLNSIIGYSEVLLDGIDGDLTAEAHMDVEDIYQSGKHLLALINDILDLAKIEAGQMKMDYKALHITNIMEGIVHSSQVLVKDKPVELTLDIDEAVTDAEIYGDAVRIRQIMNNLLSNAAKFTEAGSIAVRVSPHEPDMLAVSVKDTGVGMSPEGVSLIFERFSQVDGSSTRRAGGTGLGLTITRELISMHGGEIFVESETDVGSTFRFTLPIHQTNGN